MLEHPELDRGGEINPSLSAQESDDLAQHEEIIARGIKTFVEVGNALLAIRDDTRKLYRQYGTFEDYCRERWQLKQSRVYQLMDAASVVNNLSSTIVELPQNEAQARELAQLEPDEQRAAWQEVVNHLLRW